MMDVERGGGGGGFPSSHTTTTTTTATSVNTAVRFDPTYVQNLPGTLKCAQLVLDLIGFICVSVAKRGNSSPVIWFSLVAMGGFFMTLILLLFFLFHLIEKFHFIPWLIVEFVYCGVWTFFYFTAATAAATQGGYDSAMAAAAFFGYATMLVYAFDSYLKYISYKAGDIAQGSRITNKTTTNDSASPSY